MDKDKAINQAIDQQLTDVQQMREAKRQVQASYELGQIMHQLQENEAISEGQIERLVAVLTRIIREPLDERIAFQQEQINHLRQQVEHLTKRSSGLLWP